MLTAKQVATIVSLPSLFLIIGCPSTQGGLWVLEGPTPEERLAGFVERAAGAAPLVGRVASVDSELGCVPPEWASVHPEMAGKTWPVFQRLTLVDIGATHPLLGGLVEAPIFTYSGVLGFEGLFTEDERPDVLILQPWGGTEVPCGDTTLSAGFVVVGGWLSYNDGDVPQQEAFDALAQKADETGLVPLQDLDVAVQPCCLTEPGTECCS